MLKKVQFVKVAYLIHFILVQKVKPIPSYLIAVVYLSCFLILIITCPAQLQFLWLVCLLRLLSFENTWQQVCSQNWFEQGVQNPRVDLLDPKSGLSEPNPLNPPTNN